MNVPDPREPSPGAAPSYEKPNPPPPSRKEGARAAGCPCPLPRFNPIPMPPPSLPASVPPLGRDGNNRLPPPPLWDKGTGDDEEDDAPNTRADGPPDPPAKLLPGGPARPVPSPPPPLPPPTPPPLPGNPRADEIEPMLPGTPPGTDDPVPTKPPFVLGSLTQLPVPPVSLARKPRMPPLEGAPGSPIGVRAIEWPFVFCGEGAAAEGAEAEGEADFVAIIHGCALGCSSSAGKSRTQSSSINS